MLAGSDTVVAVVVRVARRRAECSAAGIGIHHFVRTVEEQAGTMVAAVGTAPGEVGAVLVGS